MLNCVLTSCVRNAAVTGRGRLIYSLCGLVVCGFTYTWITFSVSVIFNVTFALKLPINSITFTSTPFDEERTIAKMG